MKKFLLSMIVVLFAGCIVLAACGVENELGFREENDGDMVSFNFWGDTAGFSTVEVNQITLTGEEGSEFLCTTSSGDLQKEGRFLLDTQSGDTSVTVPSGSTIFWAYRYYDEEGMKLAQDDQIWLEFINRKDENIVGYAVVRVDKITDCNYEPTVVKSVTFPHVNGRYQTVTMEQVAQLISNAEQN